MIIGMMGSGQNHAIDKLSARDLPNVHGARTVKMAVQEITVSSI